MVDPFLPEAEKLAAARDALPAVSAGMYLDTGTSGPLPAETARAMQEIADRELRFGRADAESWDDFLARMDECRAVLAALVGGDPADIALMRGTTDGLNVAAGAHAWEPGDRVVTTDSEHPGGLGPLVTLREARGAELVIIPVLDAVDDAEILERMGAAIDDRTRLVLLSHVGWLTGARLPVTQIGELARARGAWFAVDAAQSAGAIPLDVPALSADFVAFSGHKWLLGPEGTGALWTSARAQSEACQSISGSLSYEALSRSGRHRAWTDARRFEWATFHRPSVVGLARSVGWLEMYLGLDWIHERGARLAQGLCRRLSEIEGVRVLTPLERMGTLVSFTVAGWTGEEIRAAIGNRVFGITRTVPELEALRVSVGFFNTEEEMERLVDAVGLIARHTPATLPGRPTLVVL
jgi:L-cysteine/cystine lyase